MNNADTSVLPLQQKGDEEAVLTEFWADNWANVSKETRRNTINTTTIIVFQESSIGAVCIECEVSIPKTKSEEATVKFDKYNKVFYDKHEPNIISFERVENKSNISLREFSCKFFTWLYLHYCNRFEHLSKSIRDADETLAKAISDAIDSGIKNNRNISSTTYKKVTASQAIYSYLKYFQWLAKEMNLPYVKVTLDVGACLQAVMEILPTVSQYYC